MAYTLFLRSDQGLHLSVTLYRFHQRCVVQHGLISIDFRPQGQSAIQNSRLAAISRYFRSVCCSRMRPPKDGAFDCERERFLVELGMSGRFLSDFGRLS